MNLDFLQKKIPTHLTEYRREVRKNFNLYVLILSILSLSESFINVFRGFYDISICLVFLSFYLSQFIFTSKMDYSIKFIMSSFFVMSFLIFLYCSYAGFGSGIDLYYIIMLTFIYYLFEHNLKMKHVFIILFVVIFFISINIWTEYCLFYNVRYNNIIQRRMLISSIFYTSVSLVFSMSFVYKMRLYTMKFYSLTQKANVENKKLDLRLDNKKFELLDELAKKNTPLFMLKFSEFFPVFVEKIKLDYSDLVSNEIEVCCYLLLNYSTKDIAVYTKSSVRAIESKKYRIRKKLKLEKNDDLIIWIINFNNSL